MIRGIPRLVVLWTMLAIVVSAIVARIASGQPADGAPPAGAASPQRWKGAVQLPGGMTLDFMVSFTRTAGAATGAMSIPMQGLKDGELRDVTLTAEKMEFTLGLPQMPESAWAHFAATVDPGKDTATGTLKQSGMEFPLTMKRAAEGDDGLPRRPQNPVPPLPYSQREVIVTNPADGASLAGTLTIPQGKGPHAAVFLITGSGPEDRDETIFGHKPFLVIADHLTRAGIAVLRVDDRGVGGSTSPKHGEETTEDFVGDALAAAQFLKQQPEVDPKRIGLIGHSEGGVIAPMAAARSTDIAFIVMLAGTGVPGREVLREQLAAILRASGADEETIATNREAQAKVLDLVARGAPRDEVRAVVRELVAVQMGAAAGPDAAPPADKDLDAMTDQSMTQLDSPWMRTFLTLDPRESLRKVRCPVLALNGSLDAQVIPEQNLPEIKKALAEAGNGDVTATVLPGLNHLFQTARTGGVQEYATIEETFALAALEMMSAWILDHTRRQ